MTQSTQSKSPEREPISMLRRWCPIAETHQDADWVDCPWEHDERPNGHNCRLRRMLVCSVPDCQQGYFNQKEFDEHECYSVY